MNVTQVYVLLIHIYSLLMWTVNSSITDFLHALYVHSSIILIRIIRDPVNVMFPIDSGRLAQSNGLTVFPPSITGLRLSFL